VAGPGGNCLQAAELTVQGDGEALAVHEVDQKANNQNSAANYSPAICIATFNFLVILCQLTLLIHFGAAVYLTGPAINVRPNKAMRVVQSCERAHGAEPTLMAPGHGYLDSRFLFVLPKYTVFKTASSWTLRRRFSTRDQGVGHGVFRHQYRGGHRRRDRLAALNETRVQ